MNPSYKTPLPNVPATKQERTPDMPSVPLRFHLWVIVLFLTLIGGRPAAAQTTVETFNVNSTNDTTDAHPGDGKCATGVLLGTVPECTLRAALAEANANSSGTYTINLPAGTYSLSTSMNCPDGYYFPENGIPLCFAANITLNGANPNTTIIDAGNNDSDIFIGLGAYTVAINNVTIQHGYGSGQGALYSLTSQTLTVSNSVFTANNSNNNGGSAIEMVNGNLVVEGCTFTANTGTPVSTGQGVAASIDLSYFSGNTASNSAAIATYQSSGLHISNSTFTNNSASADYIIYASGPLTMVNTTITNNTVGNSTIVGGDTVVLNNDTIYNNSSFVQANILTVSNSIIGNPNQNSLITSTSFTDLGHNMLNHGTLNGAPPAYDPTTQVNVDPQLGPLEVNGGNIPTLTPAVGSPARSAGSPAVPGSNSSGACASLDARGYVRGRLPCTIGAVDPGAADPSAGLQVLSVLPATGAAGGISSVTILGTGFVQGTTVALQGSQTISPTQQAIGSSSFTIAATFDLSNISPGTYDLVVTPPGGSAITLSGGFTVQTPATPVLGADISGPTRLREGRPTSVFFTVNNTGNEDAFLVPVSVQVPGDFGFAILNPVLPPPPATGQAISDFSNVPMLVSPVNTDQAHSNAYTYLVPVVPAHSQTSFTAQITPPANSHGSSFTFDITLDPQYGTGVKGTPDPTLLSEFVQGAVDFAESDSGQTLPQTVIDAMTTYATGQFASIITAGRTALLAANSGQAPLSAGTQAQVTTQNQNIFYNVPQLSTDVAVYGESLLPGYQHLKPNPIHPNFYPDPTKVEECNALPGHYITNGMCMPPKNCGALSVCAPFSILGSIDPNDKNGPLGVGTYHFVQANSVFPYVIEFENEATATAPAQTVSVTDQIDTSKFDLSTFQLGPVNFGAYLLTPPPGSTTYSGAIDMRPSQNIIVSVTAGLNQSTGLATWSFTSLDPSTLQLTTDATAGFLPPDTAPPAGIGHVNFTINPLSSVADTATLCNTATVVFDTNNPINTAQYCNTKDISPPASMVQSLASTQANLSFPVSWSGTDSGSGVGTYTIYVSDNGGAFTAWETATTDTTDQYTGVDGHTYSFYSIATDLVGNVEAAKSVAEATTTVVVAPAATLSSASITFGTVAIGNSSAGVMFTVTSTGGDPLSVTGISLSDSVNFSQTNTCSSALSNGQTCTVTVVFNPTASAVANGPTNATLSLVSNAGTAPAPVTLTGTGMAPPYVFVVNGAGNVSSVFSNGVPQSSAVSGGGIGAAVDRNGLVFSITADGTGVSTFTPFGTSVNTTTGVLTGASALAIDGADQLWIVAPGSVSVGQILGTGTASYSDPPLQNLQKPSGVAIDLSGNVWISDSQSNTVQEIIGGAAPVAPLATAVQNNTPGVEP